MAWNKMGIRKILAFDYVVYFESYTNKQAIALNVVKKIFDNLNRSSIRKKCQYSLSKRFGLRNSFITLKNEN